MRRFEDLKEITGLLSKMEERRKLALSVSYVGIWDWDIENNTLWWDDNMFEIYEIEKQEFGGEYLSWKEKVHRDDVPKLDKAIKLCLEENQRYIFRFRIYTKHGTKSIIGFGNCIRNEKGEPIRMVGVNVLEAVLCEKHEENLRSGIACSTCPSIF
jgi:PAS domain-containing protein